MSRILSLSSRYRKYLLEGIFIDFSFVFEDVTVPCHKIVLSANSQYFRELFQKDPKCEMLSIEQDDVIGAKSVVDYLYGMTFEINSTNSLQIVRFSLKYGFDDLTQICLKYISDSISSYNVVSFSIQFVKNKITQLADFLVPYLADVVFSSFMSVIDCLDDVILYKVLNHPITQEKGLSIDFKLSIIDLFHSHHPIINPEMQKAFTQMFDFSTPGSYKYLIDHKCEWIDPEVSLSIYQRIIKSRKEMIKEKESIKENVNVPVSRYIPLLYLTEVYDISSNADQCIDAVEFCRSFGGMIKGINPFQWNLLDVKATATFLPQAVGPFFAIDGNDDTEYMSELCQKTEPFYEISFIPSSNFLIKQISIDSCCQGVLNNKKSLLKSNGKIKLGLPKSLYIRINDLIESKFVYTSNPSTHTFEIPKMMKSVGVQLDGENDANQKILRISKFQIFGSFAVND